MVYYSVFRFTGTYVLADALGAVDPYALSAEQIVRRIIGAGYTAAVEDPRSEPLEAPGLGFVISRHEQTFIVHISRDAEEIVVEEAREDRYDDVE